MFENLGAWEILLLILVALFIIGPERLPKMLKQLGKMVRKLRTMASDATADISREVGTDIDITDLNPKTFIRKHVLSEADEEALKNPLRSALGDLKRDADGVRRDLDETASAMRSTRAGRAARAEKADVSATTGGDEAPTVPKPAVGADTEKAATGDRYDADAT
ncbi:sec-independent protein translocase protein TatB [Stackebrandtia albiflava]|uniref:Sec-independent protein translocase protein TatB n=1 Tax=Stackebrandtia albiflava TaxID=406432 RepID=A0A562UPG2_9ACTN|nr:Sec-independent protein translocase protein TatB [Stackebrandtia albiflava]TWJ07515.1 sec-independent protein translocase protein TatB [Stackebrandtia albiflava]